MAEKIAKKFNSVFLIVKCSCPKEIVKKRIRRRFKSKSISDGTWNVYLNQLKEFEWPKGKNVININTSKNLQKNLQKIIKRLQS